MRRREPALLPLFAPGLRSHRHFFVGIEVVVSVGVNEDQKRVIGVANEREEAETTDLQFPEPPARGVLAEDDDELATLQAQQLRAGG